MHSPTSPAPEIPTPKRLALMRHLEKVVKNFKVICLNETHLEDSMSICDTPEQVAAYWHAIIEKNPNHNAEVESLYVIILNTRRKPKGHHLVAQGLLDTILSHPREVFRAAVIAGASAIVVMHNHPSGNPSPSEADIKVTRDLIRAGKLLRIGVLDHVVIGRISTDHPKGYCSLRELGFFWDDSAPATPPPPPARRQKSKARQGRALSMATA